MKQSHVDRTVLLEADYAGVRPEIMGGQMRVAGPYYGKL